MEHDPARLLEQYIIGKDQDKYEILETIYEECAEVEFEVNATNITFPSKIVGHKDIAKTLSADFNKQYEKVRTYYLSKNILDNFTIVEQPWLVVMKERGTELTRIGTGYYNWTFRDDTNELKIARHKIYIHTMLEIHDPHSEQLHTIQETLEYPWVHSHVVVNILLGYENLSDITQYLLIYSR